MSYETNLRSILESKDNELFVRLSGIEKIAISLLNYTQGKFPFYTPHGFSHSLAVADHLNWLLPEKVKAEMNAHEIFFLLVAAWMHDWGMIGKEKEDPEKIREFHHLRTEKYFEDFYADLKLDEHEARIIGRICRGHRKENLYSSDFDDVIFGRNIRVRRRFLASALRIADECDITYSRTPEIIYHTINPTDKSEEEFKKHLSVGGVGQLDEKYKIYISGVARDPKGARALRLLREKMQGELDSVKGILAANGVNLDIIDLRLETKGFVDKPIGFELDKKKIFELLIGQNLYKEHDVAIRELLQNAIDSCKLEKSIKPNREYKIILKSSEDALQIEDNGTGMDYSTAKNFLSVVGSSYYTSDEFKQLIEGKNFVPISKFGIGILSCFLIADGMTIETMKQDNASCKFTIGSIEEDWKYENGTMQTPGTKINLRLNEKGKNVEVEKAVKKYFVSSEIDIFIEDRHGSTKFQNAWALSDIENRFEGLRSTSHKFCGTQITSFSNENFDLILGRYTDDSEPSSLILFNQGVFVGDFKFVTISYENAIIVNAKKDLFDLLVSRENVVKNKRWSEFISSVFFELFNNIWEKQKNNYDAYFRQISALVERRLSYHHFDSLGELFEAEPTLKSLMESLVYPVSLQKEMRFLKFNELEQNKIKVYNINSLKPTEEMKLVVNFLELSETVLFNPFALPFKFKNEKHYQDLLVVMLKVKGLKVDSVNCFELILKNTTTYPFPFPDILPENVELVHFPIGWKPIVMIKQKARMVSKDKIQLGSAYWGNISLWKKLVGEEVCSELFPNLGWRGRNIQSVKVVSDQIVIVDAKDAFVEKVVEARSKKEFDKLTTDKVQRYFSYLSYLPLVLGEVCSCIIFLEVLDRLEKEIARILGFEPPNILLKRLEPVASFYIQQIETGYNFYDSIEKSCE